MCIYIYVEILPIYKNAFDMIDYIFLLEIQKKKILKYWAVWMKGMYKNRCRIHGVVAIQTNKLYILSINEWNLPLTFMSSCLGWNFKLLGIWISIYYSGVNVAQTSSSATDFAPVCIIIFKFRLNLNKTVPFSLCI